jgi:mRNA-degrading endonuclease RelE of RelBE toxin-antitoxin system
MGGLSGDMGDRIEVIPLPGYDRHARKLFTPVERIKAEIEIAENPEAWPVIPGSGGARKARVARGGKGKSGGARIIYYVVVRGDMLYLIDVYAKGKKEDLSNAQRNEIRELIEELEAEG